MNAKSLLLNHKPEPADFEDTQGATRPMFWITDYPIPEESQLMMLHRIVQVPADDLHYLDDLDAEDQMIRDTISQLDLMLIALGLVIGAAVSAFVPWDWAPKMDLESVYQAAAGVVRGWLG